MGAPSTGQADLHTHTYYSGFSKVGFIPYPESVTPPETMVDAAVKKGLDVLCITDHNEIEGAMRAERYVRENGLEIEVVVGEEVSTADGEVLGLFLQERISRGLSAAETRALITDPDQTRRIIYEFDLRSKSYTGNQFYYRTEDPTHAIGDFIAINEYEFLVIERDGSQGDLNGFKKIFRVDLNDLDSDGFVEKVEVVDLLNISDPDLISLPADTGDIGLGDPFAFPFVTIEDVVVIDSSTLGVLNDNNYPFSTGRNPNKPDDNEFIIIRLSGTAFA
ncbi:MAG: esterase-like activity of phytase family protein [Methanophagales archaeon]|nr:esterase-like activity of phytase family protein [Methanophagales archaeon]